MAVLTDRDRLPEAELRAACLDGELYALGDGFATIDELEEPSSRARAIRGERSARLIAELDTAAWIWGARTAPPVVREFCVVPGLRTKAPLEPGIVLREVVHGPDDVADLQGARVTTRLRTAVDLARVRSRFGRADAEVVRRLADEGGFVLADALALMSRRRHLPSKRRAADRLARALGPGRPAPGAPLGRRAQR